MNRLSFNVAETSLKSMLLAVNPEQEEHCRLRFIYTNKWTKEILFIRTELCESACERFKEDQAYGVITAFSFKQQQELSIQWT
jgi:hypothetical protein